MNNENLYNQKIISLKNEIRYLKTAHYKTATKISTMQNSVSINFSLFLNPDTYEIYGDKRAIITLTTSDNSDMISSCYIDEVGPSLVSDYRFVSVDRITSDVGKVKYEVIVMSQNPDDYTTLIGGGSINLNFTATLIGSSRFITSIEYRNFLGGSSW